LRGDAHLASVAAVLDVFGAESEHLVFLGGCIPAFYARPVGAPIRPTKDVDCISTMEPWILQEHILAELCSSGKLAPVMDTQFRYQVTGSDLLIDVMSPDGINIGGGTRWMREAAERAIDRTLPDGRVVRVITPAYFVALKLEAFIDRGEDLLSSKDIEDLVCIAVELDDLVEQITAAGLSEAVQSLWQEAFSKHQVDASYIPEIVTFHLHPPNADRRDQAEAILGLLSGQVSTS
jgi:predicted nucleotidyltransferase